MLDHLALQVSDVLASASFYETVLAPLGGSRLVQFERDTGTVVGFGATRPTFWLGPVTTTGTAREAHIAFAAPDRDAVRAFETAAVAAGAEVLHTARLWPEYHPSYYGAFVRDPDGNNIEAVCRTPEDDAPSR
ncbi:VOC family protein [Frankia sp. AgB1.9]|uniref:VOC family protein n=1 Tax=unclassified Frankia TaxID=2632575 RepID=UPI00193328A1|nr:MULTISPECIES: VOC family protein [unclassified Frankia]MBL7494680.1 VOC family protein [Frankia sp. AgW1.1]MBL7553651.1 VOC family protein [Frankia sp. AgB1.9]MBL7617665.1 VOC family protein [Frankia sp. AgB1.8]